MLIRISNEHAIVNNEKATPK